MITLRQLPYIDILSLNDMMSFDTKVNIIEHCKLARIDIPKSWRKAQIADALADIFTKDPLWTLEVLPEEELELLKKLLSSIPRMVLIWRFLNSPQKKRMLSRENTLYDVYSVNMMKQR